MNKGNVRDIEEYDYKILKKLAEDGRTSHRTLGTELETSPITVKKHVEELEHMGIIKSYGITIDYEKLGYDIVALIELTISKGKMLEVERDIAKHPNIFAVYDITGTADAILLGRFKNRRELSNLVKRINSYEYIVRTNTHIILNIIKEGTSFSALIDQKTETSETDPDKDLPIEEDKHK